jgi:hypothetical protein
MRLFIISVVMLTAACAFAQEEYAQEQGTSAGGRFLSSLHAFGKGFTDTSEDVQADYNVEYAVARVKENPVLGIFPLAMLIAGLFMNFSPAMVISSCIAAFVVMVYFPTFTPAVAIFFVFSAVYHFLLRPDR